MVSRPRWAGRGGGGTVARGDEPADDGSLGAL